MENGLENTRTLQNNLNLLAYIIMTINLIAIMTIITQIGQISLKQI